MHGFESVLLTKAKVTSFGRVMPVRMGGIWTGEIVLFKVGIKIIKYK
jgi:hypothetical protein